MKLNAKYYMITNYFYFLHDIFKINFKLNHIYIHTSTKNKYLQVN